MIEGVGKEEYVETRRAQVERLEPELKKLEMLAKDTAEDSGEGAVKAVKDLEEQIQVVKKHVDLVDKAPGEKAGEFLEKSENEWSKMKALLEKMSGIVKNS